MPAQKRLYENTDEDLPENNHENHQEQQEQQGEESDRSASSSSGRDQDEFILVRLPDIRKEVQCPICLGAKVRTRQCICVEWACIRCGHSGETTLMCDTGIIKKTRTVMECLHRFCRECIDKSMRMGNNECPACRTHCASRRSLRDDPNYDALIAALYPDIDQYEEEELAFHEDEKARNNQIQALIAQTFQRQSEALSKKRRRSQGILRRRRNYRSDDDDDANANDAGKDSSSADERCTEVKPKRSKRWRGQSSSAAGIGDGACDENDSELNRESGVASGGLVGSNSEMLAWGKGGMRSHTRYGSGSGGNGKHARNSRLAKLVEHLRNLDDNDDEADKVTGVVGKVLRQRDRVISDRDMEIVWHDSKLEALGAEHREDATMLESVLAGMEAENESLKAENARLKEENERVKGRLDQLAGQMAALKNDLSLCIRPCEVADMMLSRLWEGINISRHIVRLVDPDFPVDLINLSNRSAQPGATTAPLVFGDCSFFLFGAIT